MIINSDMVWLAQYEASKGTEANCLVDYSQPEHQSWLAVYGAQEDAYRGAADFIRASLLTSSLRNFLQKSQRDLLDQTAAGESSEDLIVVWNEMFPAHKLKVYKTFIL